MPSPPDPGAAGDALLAWYDRHQRRLPWRMTPAERAAGAKPDPYAVWLSEIMLQQTTVGAVKPYFESFLGRWPTVEHLAAAPVDDVMKAWAGLGYYSRARNLKACAEIIVAEHDGRFPDEAEALRALPGIGAYTSAAIAAIAFDRPAVVVDGNVERVVARLFALDTPLPRAKSEIAAPTAALMPLTRPGDFAQAMMDLGATICTPKRPACALCPLRDGCLGFASGAPERFPVRPPKAERPLRKGAAFVAVDSHGAILLRRRPAEGLLGGMAEVPGSAWSARADGATGTDAAPFAADWRPVGAIGHVFTHFALELVVYRADLTRPERIAGGWWSTPSELAGEALPTVMRKAIEAATPDAASAASRKRA